MDFSWFDGVVFFVYCDENFEVGDIWGNLPGITKGILYAVDISTDKFADFEMKSFLSNTYADIL